MFESELNLMFDIDFYLAGFNLENNFKGNVWVYRNYNKIVFDDPKSLQFCDEFTYYFAFWIITSIYLLLVSSCFLFCCTVCFTIFITPKK